MGESAAADRLASEVESRLREGRRRRVLWRLLAAVEGIWWRRKVRKRKRTGRGEEAAMDGGS